MKKLVAAVRAEIDHAAAQYTQQVEAVRAEIDQELRAQYKQLNARYWSGDAVSGQTLAAFERRRARMLKALDKIAFERRHARIMKALDKLLSAD